MEDRAKTIFGNSISQRNYEKALKSKRGYEKKFGDDTDKEYDVIIKDNEHIGDILGVKNIIIKNKKEEKEGEAENIDKDNLEWGCENIIKDNLEWGCKNIDKEKGVIVGNIRMGFGHYRISMAMASCANALGYKPYWMDLNSYDDTVCTKVISSQNDLYSMGSRMSQKSKIFNKFFWEPMNYEGFKKLSYNAADQKKAELMSSVFKNIPKEIPVVATHVWPAQAAIHAGMKRVVNAIPDNWPMALHLSEGSIHTIQTHNSYMGYRVLNGMDKNKILKPMPGKSLIYTGHYVDHELVSNVEKDCEMRIKRFDDGKIRFLLTIGGAGAGMKMFKDIIKYLLPAIKKEKVVLFVNVGDYLNVFNKLKNEIEDLKDVPDNIEFNNEQDRGLNNGFAQTHFNNWEDTKKFIEKYYDEDLSGIHFFMHENIFEAVYCTNLLMRISDVLITKPSELAFYPIPKIFLPRIGGHEKWGAIHSAEMGDGTFECRDLKHVLQMIKIFAKDEVMLKYMCDNIILNKKHGLYDGAYKVIKLAVSKDV